MPTKTHDSLPDTEPIKNPDIQIGDRVYKFITLLKNPSGDHVQLAADRNVLSFFKELARRRMGILPEIQTTRLDGNPSTGHVAFYQDSELPKNTWIDIENDMLSRYPVGEDPFRGFGQETDQVLNQDEVREMVGSVLEKWQFDIARDFSETHTH